MGDQYLDDSLLFVRDMDWWCVFVIALEGLGVA